MTSVLFLCRRSSPVRYKEHRASEVEFSPQPPFSAQELNIFWIPPSHRQHLIRDESLSGKQMNGFSQTKNIPFSMQQRCCPGWEVALRHENAHEKSSLQLFVLQWSSLDHFCEHFYQLLLSDITPMAKSDLSSFLCPSFIYFGLINGLYTDLELILMGFFSFSVPQNGRVHLYQDGNELPTNYILCSTSFQSDIIQMTTAWEPSMH